MTNGSAHSFYNRQMEKNENKFYLRLGIFVISALTLLIIGIFWIGKQKHLFDPTFRLAAEFGAVSGLQVGNNVRFGGINVGTVDKINITNDTTIRVEMILG